MGSVELKSNPQEMKSNPLCGVYPPSLVMRKSSLRLGSPVDRNLHSAAYEKSVAESAYLLQQPAYDCRLASLSGDNSSEFPLDPQDISFC